MILHLLKGPRGMHGVFSLPMVGLLEDRNLNPNSRTSALGSVGSRSLRLWVGFYLNYFLVLVDACMGFNHNYVFVQVRAVH